MLSDSAKKAKYDKWLLEIIKKDTDSEPKKSKILFTTTSAGTTNKTHNAPFDNRRVYKRKIY